MELLDRYLQAVKKHLPWQRQDDIIAELRANLEAQLEDKETELGRPLTKQEAEEWLKQLGSPIQVAARYQRQQYLIGPTLFPTYWYVLKLAFFWLTTVYVVARVITVAAQGSSVEAYAGIALGLPWIWLVNAAIITLVFAVIELSGARFGGKIAQIPPMGAGVVADGSAAGGRGRWREQAVELCQGDGRSDLWMPVLCVAAAGAALSVSAVRAGRMVSGVVALHAGARVVAVLLVHGRHQRIRADVEDRGPDGRRVAKRKLWRHWAMHLLSLIPLGILLAAPGQQLFLAKNAAANAKALSDANKGLHTALMIAVAVVALQIVWHAGKMVVESYRKRVAA